MSKGELWNILPYAGLWGATPECGPLKNIQTPKANKVNLAGIPFTGDNSGANPDLRLISFYADTLEGPIKTTGPRSTFFRDYLDYKISWKIEPFGGCENEGDIKIGFYTAAYTVNDPGPNNMLLILEENGPALYKANECNRYRGCFKTTGFSDLFVVVDANVVVKLKITSSVPDEIIIPCFTELFKPYEYLSECGKLIATQYLVDNETGQTLIEPAKKYINTSKRMIDYLFTTSVNIELFETPTTSSVVLAGKNLGAPQLNRSVTLISTTPVPYFSGYIGRSDFGNYYLNTASFPPLPNAENPAAYNGDNWGFTLVPKWEELFYKVRYQLSITIPPASQTVPNEERIVRYPGSVEIGRFSGTYNWDGFRAAKQPFPVLPASGTTTTLTGEIAPVEYPAFLGFKVLFDYGSQIRDGSIPLPQVQILSLIVDFYVK